VKEAVIINSFLIFLSAYSVDEEPEFESRLKSRGGERPSTPSKKEVTPKTSETITPSTISIVHTPGTTQIIEAPTEEDWDSDVEKERKFAEEIDQKLKKREEQERKKQNAKGMYY
jgi:hypothetical protein